MQSAVRTESLVLAHPAAEVSVLSSSGLKVTELTAGTLHLTFERAPTASLALRVDHSFVTVTVPAALGFEHLREALTGAVPEGYLVLAHDSRPTSSPPGALIVTLARAWEDEAPPRVFCTSFDARLRARKVGPNRLLLKGVAKGGGDLVVRIDETELRLRLLARETPSALAQRLRTVLAPTHITLLTVPDTLEGEVALTVLPRR